MEVNLFAPDAVDFTYVLSQDELTNGQELLSLNAVDLDGDQITYTILSEGIDTDGDGVIFYKSIQTENCLFKMLEKSRI